MDIVAALAVRRTFGNFFLVAREVFPGHCNSTFSAARRSKSSIFLSSSGNFPYGKTSGCSNVCFRCGFQPYGALGLALQYPLHQLEGRAPSRP